MKTSHLQRYYKDSIQSALFDIVWVVVLLCGVIWQTTQSQKKTYDMKSAELLELERELGLSDDFPSDEGIVGESPIDSGGVIPGGPKPAERRLGGGCVQTAWLCGVFGGCVPASYACWLHDWAILNEDKYAGECINTTYL